MKTNMKIIQISKRNKSEKMLDLRILMKPYFCILYLIMYHQ